MNKKLFLIIIFFICVSRFFGYVDIEGTNVLRAGRIGYLNKRSLDTSFINPAALPFLEKKLYFSLYTTKFNSHFDEQERAPEKHILSIYQPFEYDGGLQFYINNFDSMVGYNENHMGFNYAQKLFNTFSIGFGIDCYFSEMEIWNEDIQDIEKHEFDNLFINAGLIWNIYNNIYISSSVNSINSDKHHFFDNGIIYKSRYGNMFVNINSYVDTFENYQNEITIGYEKSLLDNLIVPSIGYKSTKYINTGFSVNYKSFSFDFAYRFDFNNEFYDQMSFGISLKMGYDWYAAKKDVFVERNNNTNFFHFIVITKEKIKVKDKWIKAVAKSPKNPNEFKQISIKTNINNNNIKNAYLYLKLPKEWVKKNNMDKNDLNIDIKIKDKRKNITVAYLYEDNNNYYYMTITEEL